MARALPIIEGNLVISDAQLAALLAGQQVAFNKIKGSLVVYPKAWTPEQATAFVAAAVAKPPTGVG